ncbi:MAG: hypothetical protein R3B13_15680 [Polyangiaceae bacterium]
MAESAEGPENAEEEARGSGEDERIPPRRASKKKSKKKLAEVPKRPPLDAAGRERPRFILDFPEDARLNTLVAAFEAGDYATVRSGARDLIASSKKRRVREAAEELLERTAPDPLMKYLLLASIVLLAFLTLNSYFRHGH